MHSLLMTKKMEHKQRQMLPLEEDSSFSTQHPIKQLSWETCVIGAILDEQFLYMHQVTLGSKVFPLVMSNHPAVCHSH